MPTITSAVLSVVTSYDSGTGNTGDQRPFAVASFGDYRLYDFASMTALSLNSAYLRFELAGTNGWLTNVAYATRTYSTPILPISAYAKASPGATTYTPGSTTSELAYDPTSLATMLDTLALSFIVYAGARVFAGSTDGLGTAKFRVYGAYIDVTFDDASTARYWATNATVLPAGTYGSGSPLCPAPGTPTQVLNSANAIDQDDATYAELQATSKIVTAFSNGPLWNTSKLVLADWSWGSVLCNSPARGIVGVAYSHSFDVTATSGTFTWSISAGALPTGLTLNASTGAVTGTPTVAGTYSFTVRAEDPGAIAATVNCSIVIDPWGVLSCNNPPSAAIDQPYSHSFGLAINGGSGPYTWSISSGALPDGLTLNTATGAVTGTPTVDAVFHFTVSVVDSSGISISISCSIRIANNHYLLDLWVWRVLQQVESVDETLQFPPGYERGLRLQLASEFGRQYPGRDLTNIKLQLKPAIAAIDQMNAANAQAIEELPPAPPEPAPEPAQ